MYMTHRSKIESVCVYLFRTWHGKKKILCNIIMIRKNKTISEMCTKLKNNLTLLPWNGRVYFLRFFNSWAHGTQTLWSSTGPLSKEDGACYCRLWTDMSKHRAPHWPCSGHSGRTAADSCCSLHSMTVGFEGHAHGSVPLGKSLKESKWSYLSRDK